MHKLDVIVITYNRTDLLEKTFHSICQSTYNDCVIKLFNNGGTAINADFIKPFQKEYPAKKIEYHSVPVNCQGEQGIKNLCALMEAEYAVLFHDDDLVHPFYLENAMQALRENPDAVLLTAMALETTHPDDLPCDPSIIRGKPVCTVGDEQMLAALYMCGVNLCFPSTIYLTDIFKNNRFDWTPYLKYGDRPQTLYYASFGKTLILLENYMFHRVHAGQDMQAETADSLHIQQYKNYFELYKNILTSGNRLYRKIWRYYSKRFIKLFCNGKINASDLKYLSSCRAHNRFLPKSLWERNRKHTIAKFESILGTTLDDIFNKNTERSLLDPWWYKQYQDKNTISPAVMKNIIGNNNIVNIEKHGGGYIYKEIITRLMFQNAF